MSGPSTFEILRNVWLANRSEVVCAGRRQVDMPSLWRLPMGVVLAHVPIVPHRQLAESRGGAMAWTPVPVARRDAELPSGQRGTALAHMDGEGAQRWP
ncbi:hypothetical protein CDO52_19000 [Nocardiopsis gilva YIM 90087]|uniref:Uncharacterized protein n=1 Tax=Nocardiopsis gilva YIM 90087 TaxID=1235441 RepID=A0A223S925_9ACTN|nr:hypothetical protein CDO52_19000 [Nocardiopsis gilva YIM 90087]